MYNSKSLAFNTAKLRSVANFYEQQAITTITMKTLPMTWVGCQFAILLWYACSIVGVKCTVRGSHGGGCSCVPFTNSVNFAPRAGSEFRCVYLFAFIYFDDAASQSFVLFFHGNRHRFKKI